MTSPRHRRPALAPADGVEPPRRTFSTGAERTSDGDDCRLDLIPSAAQRAEGRVLAAGALKYSPHNWRRGMPWSITLNHILHHLQKWADGDESEDHLAHARCGLSFLIEFRETHPELDDRYRPNAEPRSPSKTP